MLRPGRGEGKVRRVGRGLTPIVIVDGTSVVVKTEAVHSEVDGDGAGGDGEGEGEETDGEGEETDGDGEETDGDGEETDHDGGGGSSRMTPVVDQGRLVQQTLQRGATRLGSPRRRPRLEGADAPRALAGGSA